MKRDEYEELMEDIDDAERVVHELEEEIRPLTEETEEWYSVFHELTEAENHLTYLRAHEEDFTDRSS